VLVAGVAQMLPLLQQPLMVLLLLLLVLCLVP
jgi:hypothetical protein